MLTGGARAYLIEALLHAMQQDGVPQAGLHIGVGGDDAEQGGHVGVDHPTPLGDSSYPDLLALNRCLHEATTHVRYHLHLVQLVVHPTPLGNLSYPHLLALNSCLHEATRPIASILYIWWIPVPLVHLPILMSLHAAADMSVVTASRTNIQSGGSCHGLYVSPPVALFLSWTFVSA